jgi:dephospho-CoA kinase
VGCGKSEVGRVLTRLGVSVLDADAVVHELMAPETPVFREVVRRFGTDVVGLDGGIHRKKLAALVFGDKEARLTLEAVVHPPTLAYIRTWCEQGTGPAAVMIPLLFEVGFVEGWTAIWCVSATPESVGERLRARGWDDASVEARRAAQWSLAEKEKRSDVVLHNNGSREELAAEVQQAWMKLLKRSA